MKLKNKVMVVTGGGSGIGRELVLHLLDKGAEVAAIDINEKTLKETKQIATSQISGDLGDVSGKLSLHVLDITNKEKVELFPEKVIETHGKVDGLINNAGIIQPFVKIKDLEYDAIERVMNVNFYGVLYMR